MTKFKKAGIQPFGVNPAGVGSHQSYVEKLGFNFPLLSDPERVMARAYAALKDDDKGVQRTVYVIARDRTVRFAQRGAPRGDANVAGGGGGGWLLRERGR